VDAASILEYRNPRMEAFQTAPKIPGRPSAHPRKQAARRKEVKAGARYVG
jgi:hypothetical protein